MFKTIIAGIDGREGGRDAAALAARFADVGGGRLLLGQVFRSELLPSRATNAEFEGVMREQAEALVAAEREAAGVAGEPRVIGDLSAAHGLHRLAEQEDADLLVVGPCHRGRLGRALAGDDARDTLHGAPCAVAVAVRTASAPDGGFARIGVGYDGSPESERALAAAAAIARSSGGELRLLRVVGEPEPEAALDGLLDALDVPARGEVLVGTPADALERLSEDVDLLCVGARGVGPVRRVALGSTSDHVVRHAHAPVIVAPRGDEESSESERPRG